MAMLLNQSDLTFKLNNFDLTGKDPNPIQIRNNSNPPPKKKFSLLQINFKVSLYFILGRRPYMLGVKPLVNKIQFKLTLM